MNERDDTKRQHEGCVCSVPDGLVQEWVSKAREVAKAKGYLVDRAICAPAKDEP